MQIIMSLNFIYDLLSIGIYSYCVIYVYLNCSQIHEVDFYKTKIQRTFNKFLGIYY